MSDDLISRKALIEEIQSFRCSITGLRAGKGVLAHAADEYMKSVSRIIDEQPAAFDKERVIEELNRKSDYARNRWLNQTKEKHSKYWDGKENGFREAIQIVEKGGVKHD